MQSPSKIPGELQQLVRLADQVTVSGVPLDGLGIRALTQAWEEVRQSLEDGFLQKLDGQFSSLVSAERGGDLASTRISVPVEGVQDFIFAVFDAIHYDYKEPGPLFLATNSAVCESIQIGPARYSHYWG